MKKRELYERCDQLATELRNLREIEQRKRAEAEAEFEEAIYSAFRDGREVLVIMPNGKLVRALVHEIDINQDMHRVGVILLPQPW